MTVRRCLAALVIASEDAARRAGARPVWFIGSGLASWMFDNTQQDLTSFGATRAAAKAAYADAQIEASEVDDQPWGRFVFFADPDGNRWSLQQIPDYAERGGS